ncbi:hypothetical protein F7725_024187, partial [Dissostichus mawsoni]
ECVLVLTTLHSSCVGDTLVGDVGYSRSCSVRTESSSEELRLVIMAQKSTPGWFGAFLSATTIAIIVGSPLSGRVSRVYLTPDQLRRLHFKPTIGSIQLSEGHEAKFNCSIDIPDARLDPTILWVKNGQELAGNVQVVINELQTTTDGVTTLLSTVSIVHVQRADSGEYRCRLSINSQTLQSQPITIEVEGLPTFIHQPEDRNVTRSKSFTLSCEAVGPPDPVQIRWLRDGLPDSDFHNSPSSYSVSELTDYNVLSNVSFAGVDKYTQFSCEAYNSKGVTTSREANINIKVLPGPVSNVTVTERQSNKLLLSWSPGHDGFSPITTCLIRVREVSRRKGEVMTIRFINVTVPSFQSEVPGLKAMTWYNLSVSCSNEVGASPVTMWIQSNTIEGVPSVYPRNVTARMNESWLVVRWKPPPDDKINGILSGYDVIIRHGPQQTKIHTNTSVVFVDVQEFNTTYSVEVAACTQAGRHGQPTSLAVVPDDRVSPSSSPEIRASDSVNVVLGVVCGFCLLLLIIWGAICFHNRTYDSWLGRLFGGGEKLLPDCNPAEQDCNEKLKPSVLNSMPHCTGSTFTIPDVDFL